MDQARTLSRYAEELYRASIELAGTTGNLSWAQREWEVLHQMLDDLYPGKTPSPETAKAYQAVMGPTPDTDVDVGLHPEPVIATVS